MKVNRVEECKMPCLLLLWLSLSYMVWRIPHWDKRSKLFLYIFSLHFLGILINSRKALLLMLNPHASLKGLSATQCRRTQGPLPQLPTTKNKTKQTTKQTKAPQSGLAEISHHANQSNLINDCGGLLKLSGEIPQWFCFFIYCVL